MQTGRIKKERKNDSHCLRLISLGHLCLKKLVIMALGWRHLENLVREVNGRWTQTYVSNVALSERKDIYSWNIYIYICIHSKHTTHTHTHMVMMNKERSEGDWETEPPKFEQLTSEWMFWNINCVVEYISVVRALNSCAMNRKLFYEDRYREEERSDKRLLIFCIVYWMKYVEVVNYEIYYWYMLIMMLTDFF